MNHLKLKFPAKGLKLRDIDAKIMLYEVIDENSGKQKVIIANRTQLHKSMTIPVGGYITDVYDGILVDVFATKVRISPEYVEGTEDED